MATQEEKRDGAIIPMFMHFAENLLDEALASPVATSPYFLVKTDVPIIAGYCVYRDGEYLRSSLDSICMYANAIVVWDGRFLDFNEMKQDNTFDIFLEVSERFDPRWFIGDTMTQKFIYVDTEGIFGPMLEVEKRDLMFQTVREKGFLLIMDGDEVAIGDVKAGFDFVRANSEKKIFWIYVDEEGNPGWKPRIIKVEQGMHYGANHWTILDKKNELVTDSVWKEGNPDHAKITQFKIYNFGSKRSGERGRERIAYRESMRKKLWNEQEIVRS